MAPSRRQANLNSLIATGPVYSLANPRQPARPPCRGACDSSVSGAIAAENVCASLASGEADFVDHLGALTRTQVLLAGGGVGRQRLA